MTLGEIPYDCMFYKDGKKYKQLIRVKHPKGEHRVVCITGEQFENVEDVMSTETIKPILRV